MWYTVLFVAIVLLCSVAIISHLTLSKQPLAHYRAIEEIIHSKHASKASGSERVYNIMSSPYLPSDTYSLLLACLVQQEDHSIIREYSSIYILYELVV